MLYKIIMKGINLKSSLLFLPVIIVIFIFELILKSYFPIRLSGFIGNYEYHPKIGFQLKKGYFTKTTDYKQEIYVNEYGTINPQVNFEGYKKIVFALGDSYTQEGGSLSTSYPSIADLLINNESGNYINKFGTINLGLGSNGGLQNIETYKIFKSKIKTPNYVFYLDAITIT